MVFEIIKSKTKKEYFDNIIYCPNDKFSDSQIFLPSKLYILNNNGRKLFNSTLNIKKVNNNYYFFNGFSNNVRKIKDFL